MGGGESKLQTAKDDGTFEKIMVSLAAKQTKPKVLLRIDRDNVMSSISHFKQSGSELHPLLILLDNECSANYAKTNDQGPSTSKDAEKQNVSGIDREFYTLLLKEFLSSKYDMFEGHGSTLLPVNNQKAIDNDMFKAFGKVIVSSCLASGPGFPHFPPYIVHFLQDKEFMHEVVADYIINSHLKEYIDDIEKAKDQNELDNIIGMDTERFMDNCGWGNTRVKMTNRKEYIQNLVQWDIFHRRRAALEQIKKGLNVLDFQKSTKHLSEFEYMFLRRDKRTATAEYIRERLTPEVEKLQPQNDKETTAKQFTLSCLDLLEEKEAAYLFQFITGLDDVPTKDMSFQVEFNRNNAHAMLPEAITCTQNLILPLGNKSKLEFLSSFDKALRIGRVGFGGKRT